jgi:hypothetical protein
VATGVVPEYLEIRVQGIDLRIPHQEIATQGMAQNDHWSALFPGEFVIHPNTVGFDSHCVSDRILLMLPEPHSTSLVDRLKIYFTG